MPVRVAVFLCIVLSVSLHAQQKDVALPAAQSSAVPRTDASTAEKVNVELGLLPAGWISQQVSMDPIWESLGLRGVNHYAYGGPVSPNEFSSRSDPDSPLYQAWFGVYTVAGGKDKFQTGDKLRNFQAVVKLAEYDQRSWLESMGDPKPVAISDPNPVIAKLVIAGIERTLYVADMQSHSDLSSGSTPLAKGVGMPPIARWQQQLSPFHEVTLHCFYSFWYDSQRDTTVIVYGASGAFKLKSGQIRDNGDLLREQLRQMMHQVHITGSP